MIRDFEDKSYTPKDIRDLLNQVSKNNIEGVKISLENGTSINSCNEDGYTPLHVAAFLGHIDMARFLINNGANINQCDYPPEGSNIESRPLDLARMFRQKEMIKLLKEYGA
jgi:ankyrin repeat protein